MILQPQTVQNCITDTDGGNTYNVASASLTSTCALKNQVCSFAATTGDLAAGTTVDYYWTYSDAAAYDNTKIPAQTPNPGRFPAAGSADLTFTIANVYDAPTDGSDMKLVTYMDHIRNAEPHNGVSSSSFASDLDRQMTYYASTGEFHFEFDLSRCGANFPIQSRVPGTDGQGNCFFDIDSISSYGEDSGHWDINWEGVATDCTPGISSCNGAPTNNLELDAYFGGPLGITGAIGAGNLVFLYDATNNVWKISGAGTGMENALDSNLPDVVAMTSFTSNIYTPVGPTPVTTNLGGVSYSAGNGGLISTQTVATGDVARIGYDAGYCCRSEHALSIRDTATGLIYTAGDTYYSSTRPNVPPAYNTNPCSASSCQFTDGSWSTGWSSPQSNIPNNGVLPAGTYDIYFWDTYGDGSDGATLVWQTIAASAGFSGGSSGPYETNTFAGRGSSSSASESFVIDLSTVSTSLGSNDGFGGVEFGSNAGDFNMICMTTAGHVMFLESTTPRCSPDATQTAAGGQWQGFALGAGKTNFQYNGNGMLYQIRNVAPDPDLTAPTVVHCFS